MKPGRYKISNEEYHSSEGISSSGIKELAKSPMHFRQYCETKTEPTPEMIKGSLVHAMILEPEIVDREFVVGEFKIRRGKDWEECVRENPGKTIVSVEENEECLKMKVAVQLQMKEDPELQKLLFGLKEESFYWEDPDTGILCKCRPDNLTDFGAVVDIKTTRDASLDSFQKTIVDLKYHVSAAFYLEGVNRTKKYHGLNANEFVFVAIETKPPYPIQKFSLSAKAIEVGQDMVHKALVSYAEAVATDVWQGYPKEVTVIDLPAWAYYKMNKR